jgi:hypothetical protein
MKDDPAKKSRDTIVLILNVLPLLLAGWETLEKHQKNKTTK